MDICPHRNMNFRDSLFYVNFEVAQTNTTDHEQFLA